MFSLAIPERKMFKGRSVLCWTTILWMKAFISASCSAQRQLLLAVPVSDPVCIQNRSCALTHADILSKKHIDPLTPCISMETFQDHTFIALRHGNDTRYPAGSLCEQAASPQKFSWRLTSSPPPITLSATISALRWSVILW